ncbi:MAG TPA: hypothetical protein PKA80_13040 [Ignavibacteriaceae bacterium]|nr:hypothetical protein [Ignavibacteriaceae bacterium]
MKKKKYLVITGIALVIVFYVIKFINTIPEFPQYEIGELIGALIGITIVSTLIISAIKYWIKYFRSSEQNNKSNYDQNNFNSDIILEENQSTTKKDNINASRENSKESKWKIGLSFKDLSKKHKFVLYLLLSGFVILFVFLITRNPSNKQYILAKSIDSTYRHNQKIADSLGILTYGNIRREDVIKAYEESIASDSSNVQAIKSLGKFYFRQAYEKKTVGWDSDYSYAIPYFLKLINTEAESSDVYYLLAWSLMGSSSSKSDNNLDFAIEKLFEATHKYPKEPSLFHLLGEAYYLKEDYERALSNYLKEWKLNSKMEAETYFQIGKCYSHMGDKIKQVFYYNIAAQMGLQEAIKALSELK